MEAAVIPMYQIVPVDKTKARAFVQEFHRHNEAPSPMQVSFAVGLEANGELVGVMTASGFVMAAEIGSRSWADDNDPAKRPRQDVTLWGDRKNAANVAKYRWELAL